MFSGIFMQDSKNLSTLNHHKNRTDKSSVLKSSDFKPSWKIITGKIKTGHSVYTLKLLLKLRSIILRNRVIFFKTLSFLSQFFVRFKSSWSEIRRKKSSVYFFKKSLISLLRNILFHSQNLQYSVLAYGSKIRIVLENEKREEFQPVSELDIDFSNERFEGSTQNIDIMAVMKRTLQLLGPECGEIFIVGSQTFYLPPKSSKGKVHYEFLIKVINSIKRVYAYLTLEFRLSLKYLTLIKALFIQHNLEWPLKIQIIIYLDQQTFKTKVR